MSPFSSQLNGNEGAEGRARQQKYPTGYVAHYYSGLLFYKELTMKSKRLKICQIDLQMCQDYQLAQAMDYDVKTNTIFNKGRGYVNVVVNIKGMIFLIPLRSYMPKKYQLKYKLRNSDKKGFVEGLDFGKTLILEDAKYLISENFKLRQVDDYYRIVDNDIFIVNKLISHIIEFNKAINANDFNKLYDPMRFKFTTFINYVDRLSMINERDYLV